MLRCFYAAAICAVTTGATLAGPMAIYATQGALSAAPGGAGTFASFDRPLRSPNGQHWMLLARTTNPGATDAVYISGQGTTGTLRIWEGVTEIESGRVPENMADRLLGINDSGAWAVILDLTGNTADDRVVVKGAANGSFNIFAREGGAVPAAAGLPAGTTYGAFNYTPSLTNAGEPIYGYTVVGPGITTANDLVWFGPSGTILAREGTGPVAGVSQLTFRTDATGGNWSLVAKVPGAPAATDDALFVNGGIALREGFEVDASMPAGTYGTISSFYLNDMGSNGDWYARGRTTTGTGFAVRNGVVLAKTADPVPGGEAGEVWSSDPWTFSTDPTFFHFSGNNLGDYIIGGFTSLPDGTRNAAWVLNNQQVVVRAGDQVDLDGDGLLDDAYIHFASLSTASPTAIGGFLTDDLWFYFTADVRNAAGSPLGQAYLRLLVPEPAGALLLTLAALLRPRRR